MTPTSGEIILTECYVHKAELETISGSINLANIYADELDVSTTSGLVDGGAHCVDVEVETISGNIHLDTGENTEKVKVSTTSGDVWCNVSNTAIRSISVDSTSGDISLGIPYDVGFTLEFSTISGGLNNVSFDMVQRDGKLTYNGGGCEIEVETVRVQL